MGKLSLLRKDQRLGLTALKFSFNRTIWIIELKPMSSQNIPSDSGGIRTHATEVTGA